MKLLSRLGLSQILLFLFFGWIGAAIIAAIFIFN